MDYQWNERVASSVQWNSIIFMTEKMSLLRRKLDWLFFLAWWLIAILMIFVLVFAIVTFSDSFFLSQIRNSNWVSGSSHLILVIFIFCLLFFSLKHEVSMICFIRCHSERWTSVLWSDVRWNQNLLCSFLFLQIFNINELTSRN